MPLVVIAATTVLSRCPVLFDYNCIVAMRPATPVCSLGIENRFAIYYF
jgi:hypothetical protein